MIKTSEVRLAILGCGERTEQIYLPALMNLRDSCVAVLIDSDSGRREALASKFGIRNTFGDSGQCKDLFDAAIVTVAPASRMVACTKLSNLGKGVLVEPPIALAAAECDEIIQVAKRNDTVVAVAQARRFLWSHQLARLFLESGTWGHIESFDFRVGTNETCFASSSSAFHQKISGGGVLMDAGVHVLDTLQHWLGDISHVEYLDDAAGGVEANALLKVRLQSGASGVVELSRTRQLRNTATIHCDRGTVEIGLDTNIAKLRLRGQDGRLKVVSEQKTDASCERLDSAVALVENFVASIRGERKSEVDVHSAVSVLGLIEHCYHCRRPLEFDWAYRAATARA